MADSQNLAQFSMDEVLSRWPATVGVVKQLNLACIGCAIAPFCTVSDAALLHGLDVETFVARLERAISQEKTDDRTDLSTGRN